MLDWILMSLCLTCGSLVVYHHVGYPLWLKWYAKNHRPKQTQFTPRQFLGGKRDRNLPSITVLVPAYNEERWIADKIRNLASLDYPRNKLEIRILCDGCHDETAQIARNTIQEPICEDTLFRIEEFEGNRGKVAVINHAMISVQSDITALSDVSALISIDALLIAAAHFCSPTTGVVNATYQLLDQSNAAESKYWQYQSQLKLDETTLGSSLGSHGAFYLFRTHLFQPLPSNTINDDFILPMTIVKQGFVADYEPNMVALEQEPTSEEADFKRRLRISAGNMQQAIELASLFLPKHRGIALAFISGKGLRLATPYLMICCLVLSISLSHYELFAALLGLQLAAYAIGVMAWWQPTLFKHTICRYLSYLIAGHTANLIGGLRYLLGMESGRWNRVNE
ncbi:glycosyltransferase family 2 protein [Vibrio sp. SCSIO 43136]|uniref:glycosyltransferase family 2 protein n=1 Tax=Vibrio sp. SCSIO 43136 TaxID=2819101 RepID=UPI002075B6A0|nr:glycosyltransferase family 2 protein [Vibrio sp. SCSIO 43136]USD67788.1 glycosyltransferase family 2 protein [Vibrio sp. SCSIO 43136]